MLTRIFVFSIPIFVSFLSRDFVLENLASNWLLELTRFKYLSQKWRLTLHVSALYVQFYLVSCDRPFKFWSKTNFYTIKWCHRINGIFTVRNSSCGKVTFLHLSVILFTGEVSGQTLPGRHPSLADTPVADSPSPWVDTPAPQSDTRRADTP